MPKPERRIFRISPLTVLAALALAVCATPVAFGAPWFVLIYLVPLAIIVWVMRTRTVVDADAVTVRTVLRSRRVPWVDITSLRLGKKAKVSAVLADGAELPLPAVHVRDLPQLAAVSGGRLPDPSTVPTSTEPTSTEPTSTEPTPAPTASGEHPGQE